MHFFLSSARKDINRRRRDPLSIALWIGIPLVIGCLIILAFGRQTQPQAHLLVADQDDSLLSGLLIGALSQDVAGGVLTAEEVTSEEGQARIDAGDASALLIIPQGFSKNFLLEQPTELILKKNPSQTILPAIIEEMLSMLVDAGFYVHRVFGRELKSFAGGPPGGAKIFPSEQVAGFSTRINEFMNLLADYIDPMIINIQTSAIKKESDDSGISIGMLFIPSILFMSLLFMAQGISSDVWLEHEQRTLRRVVSSPQRLSTFLLGKMAAGAMFMLLVCLVGLSIGYLYFKLDLASLPLAALWAAFSGIMLLSVMLVIQLIASSQRGGEILSMAIIFPLMMAGGSFFPFEAMPGWMAAIGRMTPNGWALEQLKKILIGSADAGALAMAFLGLLAATVALLMVSNWRLRKKFGVG